MKHKADVTEFAKVWQTFLQNWFSKRKMRQDIKLDVFAQRNSSKKVRDGF